MFAIIYHLRICILTMQGESKVLIQPISYDRKIKLSISFEKTTVDSLVTITLGSFPLNEMFVGYLKSFKINYQSVRLHFKGLNKRKITVATRALYLNPGQKSNSLKTLNLVLNTLFK